MNGKTSKPRPYSKGITAYGDEYTRIFRKPRKLAMSAEVLARWNRGAELERKYGCELRSGSLIGYSNLQPRKSPRKL